MIEVVMPTLGLTMEEGTIVRWLKAAGEAVRKGEPLLEVQNEKATVEVESPATGVLQHILVGEGETVRVSTPIARIAGDAAAPVAPMTPTAASSATSAPDAPTVAATMASQLRTSLPDASPATSVAQTGVAPEWPGQPVVSPRLRIIASPRARKAARERGVALEGLRGTGPNGRITEPDVLAAANRSTSELSILATTPAEVVPLSPMPGAGDDTTLEPALPGAGAPPAGDIPLSPMRRVIADRMARSARAVARVTLFMDVDVTELVRLREQLMPEFDRRGARLSYDALIARASARALADYPDLNAQWVEGVGLRRHARADVGVAVALGPEGLVVPVLRDAGGKGLPALADELHQLVEKARAGRLRPDEMTGGTFTITNLGATGVRAFTPIVNPPETAILGVGAIRTVAAFVGERVERRAELTLSLSFDHRVVDGLPAGTFLARVRDLLERPYALVMDL